MSDDLVLIDREALLAELRQAFDAQTAEVLLHVLDKVAAQVRQSGVTREDFRELKQIVTELAEAQRRTEERVSRLEVLMEQLIEAQRRTEEKVAELAEAQRRTEEAQRRTEEKVGRVEQRLGRIEEIEERMTEVESRMVQAIADLTRAIDDLRKQVGGLSDTVGGDIEDIAYIVLHDVLKREFGWQAGVLQRSWQTWGRDPEEVNIFGKATDPARPDRAIW
ncbi:MAG: hypothetical protein MN733_20800, partial [Nitrososphaera sp.]|nr:hypothetical protein [Nitrososphaera sp.]